jgi:hypothetical protein
MHGNAIERLVGLGRGLAHDPTADARQDDRSGGCGASAGAGTRNDLIGGAG